MILPVILCGGSGTRLWPLSRQSYPKQFLALQSSETLLQETLSRLVGLNSQDPIIVCNEEHRFIVAEQLRQVNTKSKTIILEPEGRNTAPALALAALKGLEENDPVLLVMPADHVIKNKAAFHKAVKQGEQLASKNHLVTFGIPALTAETGYGYIKANGPVNGKYDAQVVCDFVEKPSYKVAQGYIDENKAVSLDQVEGKKSQWLWNSGIFMCKASKYLNELSFFRDDIYQACRVSMVSQNIDKDFTRINEQAFISCPAESIDYAVMEPASKLGCNNILGKPGENSVMVVPLMAGWNDIGGFSALWNVAEKDTNGNVLHGDIKAFESTNSLVISDHRLITTLGIKELIVIDTKDALLVADKAYLHKLKDIVQALKLSDRNELNVHREVFRPWGKYDLIDSDNKFKVKRLTVKPQGKLSLQSHTKRSEYWVIVSGKAKVINENVVSYLLEGESVFIPANAKHSLENIGSSDLQLIEVQSGYYLGEDDIIRYEDNYGRS